MSNVFVERLNAAINMAGITRDDLAKRLGTTRNTINSYATGKVAPKITVVYDIARALDISVTWLMGVSDSIDNDSTEMETNLDEAERLRDEITNLKGDILQITQLALNLSAKQRKYVITYMTSLLDKE